MKQEIILKSINKSGVEGPMKDEKGRPTRKALALKKWDCR